MCPWQVIQRIPLYMTTVDKDGKTLTGKQAAEAQLNMFKGAADKLAGIEAADFELMQQFSYLLSAEDKKILEGIAKQRQEAAGKTKLKMDSTLATMAPHRIDMNLDTSKQLLNVSFLVHWPTNCQGFGIP
eukprot:222049-Lingulodinium_polyedra.AAC.1